MSKLIKNTSSLSEFIFSGQCSEKILDEFQLVLPALMEAQRNGDYILQADILEGDLWPLLQKIQIVFQERDMVQVPDFLNLNMRSMKKKIVNYLRC